MELPGLNLLYIATQSQEISGENKRRYTLDDVVVNRSVVRPRGFACDRDEKDRLCSSEVTKAAKPVCRRDCSLSFILRKAQL